MEYVNINIPRIKARVAKIIIKDSEKSISLTRRMMIAVPIPALIPAKDLSRRGVSIGLPSIFQVFTRRLCFLMEKIDIVITKKTVRIKIITVLVFALSELKVAQYNIHKKDSRQTPLPFLKYNNCFSNVRLF